MVLNDIKKLLDKYDNCETRLEEEKLLKKYFTQEIVPAHLEMYKPFWLLFNTKESIIY